MIDDGCMMHDARVQLTDTFDFRPPSTSVCTNVQAHTPAHPTPHTHTTHHTPHTTHHTPHNTTHNTHHTQKTAFFKNVIAENFIQNFENFNTKPQNQQ